MDIAVWKPELGIDSDMCSLYKNYSASLV